MSAKGTPDVGGSVLSQETEKDAEHSDPDRQLRRSNRTRRMNVRLDSESVLQERIAHLSKCKAGALSAVTAKRNAIENLMVDTNNFEQVKEQSSKLTDLFGKYMEAQQKLICTIDDKDAKTKAIPEFDEAINWTGDFEQRLKEWLLWNSANDQQDVQPSDSASQLTNVKSYASSTRSSISVARIEESARMAELQAESKALKQRQILHERERRLNEEKSKLAFELKELELETELAKVRARESVFAEAESAVTKVEKTKGSVITTDSRHSCNKTPKAGEELEVQRQKLTSRTKANILDCDDDAFLEPYSQYSKQRQERQKSAIASIAGNQGTKFPFNNAAENKILKQQNTIMKELVIQQQRTTLPRREMFVFNGDLTQYQTFCRSFKALIEDKEPDPSSKLYYLEQFTSGRAQELVRSCLHLPHNQGYAKARDLLEKKFGHRHKIAMAHIEQMTKGAVIKAEDGEALEQFFIQLTTCTNTLKAIGYINKIENPDSMKKIIERLPYKLQDRWRYKADLIMNEEQRDVTIEDISRFVEVQARSLNNPVFGKLSFPSKDTTAKARSLKQRQPSGNRPISLATKVDENNPNLNASGRRCVEVSVQTERVKIACQCCGGEHNIVECFRFGKKTLSQRLDLVKKYRLCFSCLKAGHQSKACYKKRPCKECSGKHSTLLHSSRDMNKISEGQGEKNEEKNQEKEANENANCRFAKTGNSVTVLPIVPVKVRRHDTSDYIETYALLDSGSNSTFCTDSLKRKLRCCGTEKNIKLTTIGTSEDVKSTMIRGLEVTDMNENNIVFLPEVLCRPQIPVSKDEIPTQEDIDRWEYLQEYVHLQNINSEVELLIGANVPEALQPMQVISLQNGGPYASKVALGWVINGPVGRKIGKSLNASFFVKTKVHPMCAVCTDFIDACNDHYKEMSRDDQRFMVVVFEAKATKRFQVAKRLLGIYLGHHR